MMAATLLPRNDYGRMQRVNHPGENHTNFFEDVDLSIDLLEKKMPWDCLDGWQKLISYKWTHITENCHDENNNMIIIPQRNPSWIS